MSVLEDEVRQSAALTIDSVLRQVPGFATVREQSSVVANVTAGSVSLRGLGGGSQASRTLVLLDGIPMNDAYGGWVAWARAPREILDRVEVVRGGGASIWGNLSLGGVINLMTVEPTQRSLSASALAGDHRTTDLTLALGDAGDAWSGWLSGNAFDTDGYYTLRADQIGPIDEPTAKEYETYLGKASYAPSPQVALRLSADWWSEDRERGTPLDRGSSESWSAVGNAGVVTGAATWDFHLFARHQDWENFSVRVAPDRASETPSNDIFDQPSDVLGANATWSREVASRHRLLAGADFQRIEIEHHQDLTFRNGVFTERSDVEGSQDLAGAFVQDVFDPSPRLSVQAGARFDHIRNYDGGLVLSDPRTGVVTGTRDYSDHEESVVNPSLGAVYRASEGVSLRASAYTGFRAPTPGELYKGVRAQNVITEPNSELDSERLVGAEIGADYHPSPRFFGRLTGFWNELEDLILPTTVAVAGPAGDVIPPCGRGAAAQRLPPAHQRGPGRRGGDRARGRVPAERALEHLAERPARGDRGRERAASSQPWSASACRRCPSRPSCCACAGATPTSSTRWFRDATSASASRTTSTRSRSTTSRPSTSCCLASSSARSDCSPASRISSTRDTR